ncbi:hypothetical protein LTR20_005046 [Exophiala xenobiotica]|nr:hypothetical protein LTS13_000895 [Exophiala xenobiotica]KAK5398047.1 hypothetical protein LTR79_004329 [Exophiala xenobiotica]KAK5417883.1 hypothetical protein LTR90_005057 [Exophiala xenobiotica]KAK5464340.1 hypothetical protein LTR20_005046 [Exophiala xenobiotica]KAK5498099.1 hypothetical protein LTR26_001499 [Exophiala xenobiotica]
MASPFDFRRLDGNLYDLSSANGAIRFQVMVEEFMDAIRTTPEIFRGRDEDIDTFCGLLDRKEAWSLAINVVPEFRLTQDYETQQGTYLHAVLRTLKHRRPPAPYSDPKTAMEKDILKKGHGDAIKYLETCARGSTDATNEEAQNQGDLVQKLLQVLED